MALFDSKNFNGEVFGAYVDKTPNLSRNELIKSKAVKSRQDIASTFKDQAGGNYAVIPIFGRIGGKAQNYDGNTDITSNDTKTYTQGRVVVGRANAWTEKDFSYDITGGVDFMAQIAAQVGEYWNDIDQSTLLSILKGIFAMTGAENLEFVNGHTYDISAAETENKFDGTTLNTGMQRALGDNKAKFSLAIMHSLVATNLENLNLLEYLKYTDSQGIQRNLPLATINGRMVLIDDSMPVTKIAPTYKASTDTEVVAGKTYYTKSGSTYTAVASPSGNPSTSSYYEMASEGYTKYTSYVLGDGAIEYTDCGAKRPYETSRNPEKNGGEDTLYSRQRKIFAPYGISWTNGGIISPTDEQLESGDNWSLANSNEDSGKGYFPHKAIPIARIITRG
ncbi:MAG: phage coat protein [Ruminiclostridium sp.]